VVHLPVDSLRPHPRNYRSHPDDQLTHITRSLDLHGVYRNVVVARDGTILAGHGVVLAAQRLGLTELPVVRLDVAPEDTAALQVLTGDNEIANLASDDDRMLTELLRELAEEDLDALLGTGFDQQQAAALALMTRPRGELPDQQAAAEWIGLPEFEQGEPTIRVVVKFLTTEERDAWVAECGLERWTQRVGDIWTTWWPWRERDDRLSVKYQEPDLEPADG
jgi:hypothetical protein